MKRLILFLLAMLNTLWAMAQFSGSGSGTESDPYLIYNPVQLLQVENAPTKHFKLMTDIDVSEILAEEVYGWAPIGNSAKPFSGVFDGNGHKITGLYINRSNTDYVGFFSYVTGSIYNMQIEAISIKGKNYVGTLAGYASNQSDIHDCIVSIDSSDGVNGESKVGGVIGYSANTLTNMSFYGNASSSGAYCGGIVGYSISKVGDSSAYGDIEGLSEVGGIAGELRSVTNSRFYGNVSGGNRTGGLCGVAQTAINNCYAEGNIKGAKYTGGICGDGCSDPWLGANPSEPNVIISGSCFKGRIDVVGKVNYVGGIVGGPHSRTSTQASNIYFAGVNISDCIALCDITAKNSTGVGGIVGGNDLNSVNTTVKNSLYNGSIIGYSKVAGIIGTGYYASKTEFVRNCVVISNSIQAVNDVAGISTTPRCITTNCVSIVESIKATEESSICKIGRIATDIYDYKTTMPNKALSTTKLYSGAKMAKDITDEGAHGVSTLKALLKLKATYVALGWDFENTWAIEETESYPYLKSQAAPPFIATKIANGATAISGKCMENGTVYYDCVGSEKFETAESGVNQTWRFNTTPLKAGDIIRAYTEVENLYPSYMVMEPVPFRGKGTPDEPFEVQTADDLSFIDQDGNYALVNDIDLTSWIVTNSPTSGWNPTGKKCRIVFDGRNHTISGLWMNSSLSYAGLFGQLIENSEIKNLKVQVAENKSVKGGENVGIVVGSIDGSISNVQVSGNVEGTQNVGGIVGLSATGTISDCDFVGKVTSSAVSTFTLAGGIVGYLKSGIVQKSKTSITLNVSGAGSSVGGIVGFNDGKVTMCYSEGVVSCTGTDSYVGGLVGKNKSVVDNSYSIAETHGTLYTGGLVGYNFGSIDKSYALGNLYGVDYGGGVVGELDGATASISNCVAMNNRMVLTASHSWAGRVLGGYKNSAVEPALNNYALNTMQVSLNDVPKKIYDDPVEGIAKAESELKSSATYSGLGWDMSETWTIEEGANYPVLKWIAAQNNESSSVAEISLDNASISIVIGKTAQLSAIVLPSTALNKQVTWTSSNTAVATVADGLVTAVAEGNATITVTSAENPEISASCEVTVSASLESAIATLRTLVSEAQSLYDNSTEGESAGQYEAGSRAALLAVINTVNGKISADMTQSAIAECTTQINDAVTAFSAKQVAEPEPAADYSMSIAPVSSASGTSTLLSVCMTNKNAINGFQFDLVLPEGVTLQKTARGKYIFNIGERGDDHTFSSILREDGSVRVVCTSLENTVFTGNSGEVCQIPVDLAESLINGTYAVRLKNVSLSDEASTDIQVNDVETNIIVLNDYFEVGTASGSVGKVVTLPVAMKNKSADICGFQCDIVMPEGFSIAVNDKGKYLLSVTERGDDHSFSALDRGNNTVRVVCTSLTNSSFTGSEGDLFEISLITSKSVEAGEYEIKLTNVALSNTASLDIPVADVSGTVTLKRYNPGDVNDDGKISVADVTAAISFVLGSESPSFIREAADMDASNEVKVNDVTAIISLVLNNDITPANAPARMLAMQRTSTENTSKLYVEPFSIAPGEEKYIDLMLDNPDLECIGWQADVQLPAGLSFVMNDKGKYVTKINVARTDGYSISSNIREENTVRFIGVSMENFSIVGTNGAIMSILVKAESNAAEGIYYGSVTNGALSDVASNDVPVDDSEFDATIAAEKIDYAEGYSLIIKPFKATSGTAYTLTMNFNCATDDITDMEFDIVAPSILTRTKSGRASKAPAFANENRIALDDHSIDMTTDGHVTISAIVSDEYRMIAETSGSLVNFYYTANAGIAEGIYQFEINNIKMTMDDGTVLDVAPYKADVFVGSSKATSENGCVAFNGEYADAATYKLLKDAMPTEGLTAVDLTGVTALPANTTITLANPNALILTSKDLGLNNDLNVVIGDECAKLVITDGYSFNAPKSFTAADASYSRAMTNKYGTIVLPYAVESSATIQYYTLSDATVSGAEGTLIFTPVSSVAANQPALFKYADGGTAEMASMSVDVAATPSELIDNLEGSELQGSWAMYGSFDKQSVASPTSEGKEAYYIKEDKFWKANNRISVSPFRSYFLNGTAMQKASYRIVSDATGIEDITDQLDTDDAVSYDLGGRQTETSEKNQVIVTNGSKTIIR